MTLYEAESGDFLLNEAEEKVMKAMRNLDKAWKNYNKTPHDNHLILYAGAGGCGIRVSTPSVENEIESYQHITCDGGDGGDKF